MLQKDRSDTTSLKSATNKAAANPQPAGPDTPVQFVKGVGPKLGMIFESRGIRTVRDLLTFFPRTYEDRTHVSQVGEVADGQQATLALEVLSSRKIPTRTGKKILEVRCSDGKGTVTLKWFHSPWGMENRFTPGAKMVATGTAKSFQGRLEIVHPEITWGALAPASGKTTAALTTSSLSAAENDSADFGRIIPIYTELDGIPTRTLRRVLWSAVERYALILQEDLPAEAVRRHGLPLLPQAIRDIHFPSEGAELRALQEARSPSHLRFIYEEFFKFEYLVLLKRLRMEKLRAPFLGSQVGRSALEALIGLLPFKLTGDQRKAIDEIVGDLGQRHPMNRLIQGDVGSGKTAVAFLIAGMVLAEGGQAALMAPTEILAEQHFKNAIKLFGGRLQVELLTGSTSQSERNRMLGRLAAGEPILLIGTHALLEDPVVFENLLLVMIDEQHRFGVDQRRKLREKGTRLTDQGKEHPHALVLTATPIPRTLALTAYGDLVSSTIKEMPPGRMPIQTRVVRGDAERKRAYEFVRTQIKAGRQAYFISPLVNESEAEGFTHLASATAEAERLAREIFPEYKVGLLHGQQRPEEKAETMACFSRGEIHVLVSTTVIEVGVDVPNSTVICIENAERFGLSQLHQLRGRVGRGSHASYCFLMSGEKTGQTSKARLEVLEQTTDGFKIAEADLEIRGPGEFLGVRQAGSLPFRMASLTRDQEWLKKARDDAAALLKTDPFLEKPENQPLRSYFVREGRLQGDRLNTS
jgi:ATP-dependent DNA helicase RecG